MTEQQPEQSSVPKPSENNHFPQLTSVKPVGVHHAFNWLAQGFELFKKSPGPWIGTMFMGLGIMLGLNLLQPVGSVIAQATTYIWVGGLLIGCRASFDGKPFSVNYLFEGFKSNFFPLLYLSLIIAALSLISFYLTVDEEYLRAQESDEAAKKYMENVLQNPQVFFTSIKWALLAQIPIAMMSFFSPGLIVFHNVHWLAAIKLSVEACFKNILPLMLLALLSSILIFSAMFTFFVGLIVVVPVLYGALFYAYLDIFTERDLRSDRLLV